MNDKTKTEAQAAGVADADLAEWEALRGTGMCSAVGEYTPPEFWLLLDEVKRLRALTTPASHDAQQPSVRVKPLAWREHWAGSQEDIVAWRGENPLGIVVDAEVPGQYDLNWHREADPAALDAAKAKAQADYDARVLSAIEPAQQPAVVGDGPLEDRIRMIVTMLRAEAGCRPTGYTFGEQAAMDRAGELANDLDRALHEVRVLGKSHATTAEEAEKCRAALTPAATPGEQPVTPCPHASEDECDCPTPGMDDEQALDGLALRMANTYPMAAIIRALDKHAPGIRHAFAPPKAVKEGNGNG